jgi:6-phospho-3-hexuloisomerase
MIQTISDDILNEIRHALAVVDDETSGRFIKDLMEAKRIFVLGSGRSGLIGSAFAMRLMHLGIETHVIGEVTSPDPQGSDLLVVVSGSGDTETIYDLVCKAKGKGLKVLCITARRQSRIAEKSDNVISISAQTKDADEGSLQPLGSTFEQAVLIYLDSIIVQVMRDLHQKSQALAGRHIHLE